MRRALVSVLVGWVIGCATPQRQVVSEPSEERRIANLERAAKYPWKDEGTCAAREASGEWSTLVERCFYVLDRSRIMFRDVDHRCPVAQVDAATIEEVVGVCLLVQPELAVGAIIIIGAIVVGAAIAAELAPARKAAGCYCYCLQRGVGKAPRDRVANADACYAICRAEADEYGHQGMNCGDDTRWFVSRVSCR